MKLSTNHACSIKKSKDDQPCKHFSIRGYVAGMRQKDLKMCSPFPVNEFEAQPSLPPLVMPGFRSWSCDICRGDSVFNVIDRSEQRYCSNEIQETPMLDNIPIDLNRVVDLTGDSDDSESDHLPINNEKKNDVEIAVDRITDHDLDLQNNLNHQVSNNRSLEVCPGPIQEMHTNERGFEANVASNVELVTRNLKTKDKNSYEVPNEGKHIYEDNQCLKELRKSCTLTREAIVVTKKDNVPEHTTEQFPPEPVIEDNVDAGDTDYNVENDVQDHYPKKYTRKSSKKRKKMRLLKEIMRENDEPNTKQIIKERLAPQNPSNEPGDSQVQTTIMDNVVGEEDNKKLTKKGRRGRKRKLPLDENDKPSDVFFQRAENEVQNIGPDAAEIGDTTEGKGNMLQEYGELNNDMLVEDSFALRTVEDFSDVPVPIHIAVPLAQTSPNEEGSKGLNSLNSSPQAENRLTLSWPIQEGTSNYKLIKQGGETDSFGEQRFPSTSAISGKGRGVLIQEIDEPTNEDTSAKDIELRSMKNYIDLTTYNEESDQDSLMEEVAEIMAMSLPNVENVNRSRKNSSPNDKSREVGERMPKTLPNVVDNVNSSMKNSSQKEKHPTIDGNNGTATRDEHVFPRNGIPINYSSFDGNSFGMNNIHSTQSLSQFYLLPSSGVHISSMDTRQLGSTQISMFDSGTGEFGSSNTSLHAQGYGNASSNIGKPLSLNNAFLTPQTIASHPPSNTTDMISLSFDSVDKQARERDFDLNIPYAADNDQVGSSSKTSVEYPFSGKHDVTEHHPNHRVSFDLNATDITPDMNLLSLDPAGKKSATSLNVGSSGKSKTPDSPASQLSDKSQGLRIFGRELVGPSDLGDQNMTVSGKEKMNSSSSFIQNRKKLFGWLDQEEEDTPHQQCGAGETPVPLNDTAERWCGMNRNPAEFSPIIPGNPYLIDTEDKVEKRVSKKRHGSSSEQKRKSKEH